MTRPFTVAATLSYTACLHPEEVRQTSAAVDKAKKRNIRMMLSF
jgi:hypothetical protein